MISFGFVVGVCARGQCSYGSEADLRNLLLGTWMAGCTQCFFTRAKRLLSYLANLRGGIDQQTFNAPKSIQSSRSGSKHSLGSQL